MVETVPGSESARGLLLDSAGHFLGTTDHGGYGYGTVFQSPVATEWSRRNIDAKWRNVPSGTLWKTLVGVDKRL